MDRHSGPRRCSLGRNPPFRRQRDWIQGACWIDRTGRAEGKSSGEGENQTELAVCYTSSAQSFRVRNAEKNPVHGSVTQHETSSIYWKASEHLGQAQLAQITPHPSSICAAVAASRLIRMSSSYLLTDTQYRLPGSCAVCHTHESRPATQLPSGAPSPPEMHRQKRSHSRINSLFHGALFK